MEAREMPGESELEERYDQEWFIGALTKLQSRYPAFIRRLGLGDLSVDIGFYVEDMAMVCAQSLLDNGITTVHRLDRPRTISIQIPSLLVQSKVRQAHETLEGFFEGMAAAGPGRPRPVGDR